MSLSRFTLLIVAAFCLLPLSLARPEEPKKEDPKKPPKIAGQFSLDMYASQAEIQNIRTDKGAGEPLTLTQPSEQSKEMMNWLLDDLYAQFCEQVGHARGKDKAAGKAWIDGGPYTAQQALDAKLV